MSSQKAPRPYSLISSCMSDDNNQRKGGMLAHLFQRFRNEVSFGSLQLLFAAKVCCADAAWAGGVRCDKGRENEQTSERLL